MCKVLFFVALRWAPRPFGGARAKNKHHPGCLFFFAPAPGKGRGRRSPVGRRHGAKARKKHHPGFVFFFALAPCRRPTGLLLPLPFPGAGAKKEKTPFSPSLAFRRGHSKKKTPWVVFFLLWSRAGTGLLLPLPFPGAGAKKKHPGWCLFFAAAPRGRSLTHCGPGWRCLPLAGVVFFFFCCGPARTGVFFFALAPPGRSLTQLTVGWGDFGKARVVFFFFAAAPPGLFRQ